MTRPESEAPPPSQRIDAGDTEAEHLSALERAPTDPAPPLEPEPKTNPHGTDPIDDPEHLQIVRQIEAGLDVRFDAMQAALLEKVEEVLEVLRRWADDASKTVTRVEQLEARTEHREHVCAAQHGNGTSLPPGV